ncbi:MAG TPA: hypothetical protein PK020_04595 [Ilumatobacteraceae bacterium]|nr:hypothetical protein [Ilumatobacteraceae bacterium]HRB02815.1 hypothetical protein [Ilumatobacteraceae bacterium]
MIYVVVAVAVIIVVVLGVLLSRGGSRQEPGVIRFRKHIDALSPESRREVMDRVRPPQRDDEEPKD